MKVQTFILLVFLASTLCLPRRSFLKNINRYKELNKISHGDAEEVPPHSLPYHAFIYGTDSAGDELFRSGALITLRFVVMAEKYKIKKPIVVLGAHKISDIYISDSYNPQIFTHNSCKYKTSQSNYYVTLIKLSRRVESTEYVKPIPIAPPNFPDHPGSDLIVSGWSNGDSTLLENLEEYTPLHSNIVVEKPREKCGYDSEICYKTTGKFKRDHGSPIVHKYSGLLVGINKLDNSYKGPKVSYYAEWIFENIAEDSD